MKSTVFFFKELMAIDRDKLEKLNKTFCRNRMTNIYYLIGKILQKWEIKIIKK